MPNRVRFSRYHRNTTSTAIMISKGYISVKMPPIHGMLLNSGMVNRVETSSTNLLEALPLMALFAALVKKAVSATASMLMTTPLITWLARNRMQSSP